MDSKHQLSVETTQMVNDFALEELAVFAAIAKLPNYDLFRKALIRMANRDKEYSFSLHEDDPNKLIMAHALARGKVAQTFNLLSIIEQATRLIDKKIEKKDKKNG